jgi:circadian clock protein KaiB
MATFGKKRSNGNGNDNGEGLLKDKLRPAADAYEQVLKGKQPRGVEYVLRLYVTGSTPRSLKAIYNLKRLCEEHLHDAYDLQVVDIYNNPDAAREAQIIAAPTLIKRLPEPLRRFVGDLSNKQKLLIGLGINE